MHWLSGDGHILWCNERELEVLQYTAEEYIGQSIMKFCPDEVSMPPFHTYSLLNSTGQAIGAC